MSGQSKRRSVYGIVAAMSSTYNFLTYALEKIIIGAAKHTLT